jgi:hypothetical protein
MVARKRRNKTGTKSFIVFSLHLSIRQEMNVALNRKVAHPSKKVLDPGIDSRVHTLVVGRHLGGTEHASLR